MAVIVTRETTQTDGTSPKGSPLTNAEVDTNFINLNDNKVEVSGAIIFQAKAGEALAKGDVVYVSGVSGNEPVVSKADANDASKMPAFGLAEDAANLNAAVNVVTFGTLYDLDTSAFSAGDTVYVSTTAGAITDTAPTGESSLLQNIGKVIRSHASAGSIKVGGAGRTNATPNLNDGNVFIGNASNQAAARALTTADIQSGTFADARIAQSNVTQHQAALSITESQISDLQAYLTAEANDLSSAVTWANVPDANITQSSVTQHEAALSITESQISDLQAYLTAESDTLDSVTGRGATTTNAVTVGNLTSTGIDDNATSTAITIDSSQRVGIGTNSPAATSKVNIVGGNAGNLLVDNGGEQYTQILLQRNSTANTGGDILIDGTASEMKIRSLLAGSMTFSTGASAGGATERMRIDSSGRVGIGTASINGKLDIKTSNAGFEFYPENSTDTNLIINFDRSTSSYQNLQTRAATHQFLIDATEKMRIDSSGNVGIGTTSPVEALHITTGGSATTAVTGIKIQNDTDLSGENIGISFGSPSWPDGGEIYAEDQSSDGLVDLCFALRPSGGGTPTERMRIDSSGRFLVGTTDTPSSSNVKQVLAKTGDCYLQIASGTTGGGLLGQNGANMLFYTYTGAVGSESYTERMRIDSSGNLLVGRTDAASANNVKGCYIDAAGAFIGQRGGAASLFLNRFTSDGDIAVFRRDGTTVGSLSAHGGAVNIGNGIASLAFLPSLNTIHPNGTGSGSDGLTSLGWSNNRFKDLYLSGTLTNNGTGGINIDTSGNVGIGTTSPQDVLHVEGGNARIGADDNSNHTARIKVNSGGASGNEASLDFLYESNATPRARIATDSSLDGLRFSVLSGGSITERMRLLGNGNLGIGTTSPAVPLHITGEGALIDRVSGGDPYIAFQTNGASTSSIYGGSSTLRFFADAATEAMRIDSSSRVGIGTTNPLSKFHVKIATNENIRFSGTGGDTRISALNDASSAVTQLSVQGDPLLFRGFGGAETMRIATDGQVLIGTSSVLSGGIDGIHLNTAADTGITFAYSGTVKGWLYYIVNAAMQLQTPTGTTIRMVSDSNGVQLTNGATSWSSLSDERKKDIIEPITNAAEKVSTLRTVIGKYKEEDEGTRRAFLIAQDVQKVLPEAVGENDDGDLLLQYTETIPLLVAAIKEQQAQITELKAELAALKGA